MPPFDGRSDARRLVRAGAAGGPTWGAGWTDYDATAPGYEVVSVEFDRSRRIVRGTAKRTSGSATTILTLPSGSWPTRALLRLCRAGTVVGSLFVGTDGTVVLDIGSGTYANTQAVAFEFTFDTAQP